MVRRSRILVRVVRAKLLAPFQESPTQLASFLGLPQKACCDRLVQGRLQGSFEDSKDGCLVGAFGNFWKARFWKMIPPRHSQSRPFHSAPALQDVSNQSQSATGRPTTEFSCLYTKHKTQKRRVWHDGRLVLRSANHGSRDSGSGGSLAIARLYSATPLPGSGDPVLDETEITPAQQKALQEGLETELETEQFLLQVEGAWAPPVTLAANTKTPSAGLRPRSTLGSTQGSRSMHKLLTQKFQRPKAYRPPPGAGSSTERARQQRLQAILGKRRRPLQPGELEQMHSHPQQPQHQYQAKATSEYSHHGHPEQPYPPHQNHPARQPPSQDPPPTYRPPTRNPSLGGGPSNSPQDDGGRPLPNHLLEAGPAFGAPDAFSLGAVPQRDQGGGFGQPTRRAMGSSGRLAVDQKARRGTPALGFVVNEFEAAGYYGLDEEEEEEEPATMDLPLQEPPRQQQQTSQEPRIEAGAATEAGRQPTHLCEGTEDSVPSLDPPDSLLGPASDGKELHHTRIMEDRPTTSAGRPQSRQGRDLLALFGAAPLSQSKNQTKAADADTSQSNAHVLNAPATKSTEDTPSTALPAATTGLSKSHLWTKEGQDSGAARLQFHLPVFGDSSSEGEDSDNSDQ